MNHRKRQVIKFFSIIEVNFNPFTFNNNTLSDWLKDKQEVWCRARYLASMF